MSQTLDALARKVVFGSPPEATATNLEKLLFVRRFWARIFVVLLSGFVVGLAFGNPTPVWILLGVGMGLLLVGAVKLWVDLRHERQRDMGS